MSPVFKPTPLTWDDLRGTDSNWLDEIDNFLYEWWYDEDDDGQSKAPSSLYSFFDDFAKAWEKLCRPINGWDRPLAEPQQAEAAIALIVDKIFFDSEYRDELIKKLADSATKPKLVRIITAAASIYCQYISLQNLLERALAGEKTECRTE